MERNSSLYRKFPFALRNAELTEIIPKSFLYLVYCFFLPKYKESLKKQNVISRINVIPFLISLSRYKKKDCEVIVDIVYNLIRIRIKNAEIIKILAYNDESFSRSKFKEHFIKFANPPLARMISRAYLYAL